MIKLEDLRNETESALYGLTADESLKYRILQKAAQASDKNKQKIHPFPVLCSVLAVLLLLLIGLNQIRPLSPVTPGEMTVFAAGRTDGISSSVFHSIDASEVSSLELSSLGSISDPELCTSMIRILQDSSHPAEIDSVPAHDKLIIYMKNGRTYQFSADAPYLYDGAYWECRPFFSMMTEQFSE